MTSTDQAGLEKFFEKDIIEFLDKKQTTQGSNTERNELEKSLNQNNTKLANKIILTAIKKFNQTDSHNIYKEIYFNKIIELTEIAQKYVTKNNTQDELAQNLSLLKKSKQLSSGLINNITVFDEQERQEQEKIKQQEKQEEELANTLSIKMRKISKILYVHIRKKDLENSIKEYKNFKECFEKFPAKFEEEKKELYNDLLAFYMAIQKFKKEIVTTSDEIKNIQEDKTEKTNLKSEDVNKLVNDVKALILDKEFKQAKTEILEFKHKVSLIPDKYSNIRSNLEDIANALIKKIEFAKRTSQENLIEEAEQNENKANN